MGGGNSLTISAQDAAISGIEYPTLAEAFAAAEPGQTITLSKDVEVSTMIPVTKSVTLDLNGKTLTNNVEENRLFRLSGVEFTIDGHGGSIITPETNTKPYGFVDFRDAENVASGTAKLIASDVNFKGGTDGCSLFTFRTHAQSLAFNNVNVELTESYTFSIINGYHLSVDIDLNGGEYICNSTHQTAGVFQAGPNSTVNFDGVKVTTSVGPIFDVVASKATFTDCDMTNTATNSYFASCIAPSNGSDVTVNGGVYTANYPLYIYNSGGTLNVNGGEFNGKIASVKADNAANAQHESLVNVISGTFNGPISMDARSSIEVAENSTMVETITADGKVAYVAAPTDSEIAAFVGTTPYKTLAEAFEAAEENQTIVLFKDIDIPSMIPVTKSVTLDLNGKTITNNVEENRLFRLSGVEFTIDGHGGSIITPETNTKPYGFVDFRDAENVASGTAKLIASDVNFKGGTDGCSLFTFRTHAQSLAFNNVNVELTESYTFSIINGYHLSVDIDLNGGEYICNSTHQTAGVFQAGPNSTVNFDGVKVTSSVGPIFEVIASNAVFTDCDMTDTATNSFFASCLAASNGSDVTVNGGVYTANYPLYVYNSGGTINVNGGEFNGNIASVKADNIGKYDTNIYIKDGTFNGPISADADSNVEISGGTFSEKPAEKYLADGYDITDNADGTFGVKQVPSSIVDIATPATEANGIYDLSGVKIDTDAENLPSGFYIINGKKVYIRR